MVEQFMTGVNDSDHFPSRSATVEFLKRIGATVRPGGISDRTVYDLARRAGTDFSARYIIDAYFEAAEVCSNTPRGWLWDESYNLDTVGNQPDPIVRRKTAIGKIADWTSGRGSIINEAQLLLADSIDDLSCDPHLDHDPALQAELVLQKFVQENPYELAHIAFCAYQGTLT